MEKKLVEQLETTLFLCVLALVSVGVITTVLHV